MKTKCISCEAKFTNKNDEFYCKACRRRMFIPYLIAAVLAPSCTFAVYLIY